MTYFRYCTYQCFPVSLEPDSLDHGGKTLLHISQQLQRLVAFYKFVHQQHEVPPMYTTVVADELSSPQVSILISSVWES